MQIFDFHVHSLNPDDFTKVFELTPETKFPKAHDYIPTYSKTMDHALEETINNYDRHNVTAGLISGPNNAFWLDRYPSRFHRSFQLTFKEPNKHLAAFEAGVKSGNIHGLGELGLTYEGIKLDTDIMFAYYEVCEMYDIPVLFHTGLNGPNPTSVMPHWRVEDGNPLLLEPVLGSFSKLKVVIAHYGYPFVDQTNYMLASYTNCYADLSVVNWMLGEKLYHRILEEAVDSIGSEKLLYGSDQMIWPQMIDLSIERTKSASIPREDLENIFFNNAKRLLPVLSI